jgi:hypothetical protein
VGCHDWRKAGIRIDNNNKLIVCFVLDEITAPRQEDGERRKMLTADRGAATQFQLIEAREALTNARLLELSA